MKLATAPVSDVSPIETPNLPASPGGRLARSGCGSAVPAVPCTWPPAEPASERSRGLDACDRVVVGAVRSCL